jgi:hypothetical protein
MRLTVTCRECARTDTRLVWEWATAGNVDSRLRMWELLERIRCSECGQKNPMAKVVLIPV